MSTTILSAETVLYPLFTFLLSLYTLEHSTSLFITATARLAHRLRVSETLISLLTAGAEWEELFVVVAALIQHQPRLALGNVLGSCIGNILGAFSLGVLVQSGLVQFDASSKRYAVVLFAVTTIVVALWAFDRLYTKATKPILFTKPVGALLVVAFVVYVAAVGWSIYRGILAAPEDSDFESDLDGEPRSSTVGEAISARPAQTANSEPATATATTTTTSRNQTTPNVVGTEQIIPNQGVIATQPNNQDAMRDVDESLPLLAPNSHQPLRRKSILPDLAKLLIGFIALSMSGYILSHSSRLLASQFKISESVFGATLLSLATTLPEKFVAVVSGARGHPGILVANTVGSNIFLLTLCLGVTILGAASSTDNLAGQNGSYSHEMLWLWASPAALTVVIMFGWAHRLIGVAMLLAYLTFLVLEFVVNE